MMEDENGHKRRSLRFRREDGMDEDHEMMMMENHACERGDAEALMPMMCSGQCVQVGFTSKYFPQSTSSFSMITMAYFVTYFIRVSYF